VRGCSLHNPIEEFDQEEQDLLLAIGGQIAIAVRTPTW
jgi:GAF domain-containing protein